MSEEKSSKIAAFTGGVFGDLSNRIKLIFRLMGDKRVSPLLKLLPIGSLVYFVVPDLAIGPIDDVVVMWLGTYLFVELCPPQVVEEHEVALRQALPGDVKNPNQPEGDVIDAEFWEKKE